MGENNQTAESTLNLRPASTNIGESPFEFNTRKLVPEVRTDGMPSRTCGADFNLQRDFLCRRSDATLIVLGVAGGGGGPKLGVSPKLGSNEFGQRYEKIKHRSLASNCYGSSENDKIQVPMASRDGNFDLNEFFANIGQGRKILRVRKKQRIYAQGKLCDALFYIQKGKVKLTVVSRAGKEATLGILDSGAFFGEGGLAGQPRRMGSADAMEDCELMRIEKHVMMRAPPSE